MKQFFLNKIIVHYDELILKQLNDIIIFQYFLMINEE